MNVQALFVPRTLRKIQYNLNSSVYCMLQETRTTMWPIQWELLR